MKNIRSSLNQGIEGFLPEDALQSYKLPKNRAIPVSGGRIAIHLERHFDTLLNRKDYMVEHFLPKFLSRHVTAPLFYKRRFKRTKAMLEQVLHEDGYSDGQKEKLKTTLAIMMSTEQDMELLNNYVTSLQKV